MSGPTVGVALLAFCLALTWTKACVHIVGADAMLYTRGLGQLPRAARRKRRLVALLSLLSLPYYALCVAFGLGVQMQWVGLAICTSMIVLRQVERRQWDGDYVVELGKYSPSVSSLLMWLAVFFVSGGWKAAGWEAACGVLGAAYVVAGIAKLRASGRGWFTPGNMGLMLAERALQGPAALRGLRLWAMERAWVCRVVAWYGCVIELAGVAMLFPLLRWPLVGGWTAMQIGIAILLGYIEIEWTLVPIAVVLAATPYAM